MAVVTEAAEAGAEVAGTEAAARRAGAATAAAGAAARTAGAATAHPWLIIDGEPDGALSADGRIMGSYVHGLFQSDGFRRNFLKRLGATADGDLAYVATIAATLDQLADHLEAHLDIAVIIEIARSR